MFFREIFLHNSVLQNLYISEFISVHVTNVTEREIVKDVMDKIFATFRRASMANLNEDDD